MKLRDILTIAALGMLVGTTYAYMQKADLEAAERDAAILSGRADK